jgi:DNA-binding SARP family transcriptional activator/Flp pilus assembly protein TadD
MGLLVGMLGSLTVASDGRAINLRASRKVRALLAWLALTPRATPRQRLCELLWEGTADPRAELRWHLSKLRAIVGAERIVQDEDCVRLDLADSGVDAREVQGAMQSGRASLSPQKLRELQALYRGEFLEGLELEYCPEFTAWLIAQRRRFRDWRIALLERLAQHAADDEALGYLEKWLQLAPFDVRAHGQLFDALARRGRYRDLDEHLAVATRLFTAERLDCAGLRLAWRAASAQRNRKLPEEKIAHADEQAYDCYLLGRQHLARMMHHGLEDSRQMFGRAVALEPDYGPAWAGLATVQAYMNEWFDAGKGNLERAEQASRRALMAAPNLAEAHAARGLVQAQLREHGEAAREFAEAIRLNPYLFEPYYFCARTAFANGDLHRAAEMFGLAAQARPEDFQSPILLGLSLGALGRHDAAREATRMGIHRAELVLAVNPRDGRALSLGGAALMDDDQGDRALEWSRKALELYPRDTSALINGACVHAKAGEPAPALDLLERVFALGFGKRDWVVHDPDYAILWPEPRFQQWLGRLK